VDPDPAIFVIDLHNANKKCLLLLEETFTSFFKKDKKSKKVTKQYQNQGFCYYCCLMIEGSTFGAGSMPLTCGSGSARSKSCGSKSGTLVAG
jgi:hypothetical protein